MTVTDTSISGTTDAVTFTPRMFALTGVFMMYPRPLARPRFLLIPQVMDIALSPTLRESEVLSLVGKGLRVVDVAIALELVSSTVSSHIKAIYRKLNISIRAEAAFQTARLGLLRG